jgi:hypothetical protein
MSFIEGLFADPKLLVGPVGFVQMIVLLVRARSFFFLFPVGQPATGPLPSSP